MTPILPGFPRSYSMCNTLLKEKTAGTFKGMSPLNRDSSHLFFDSLTSHPWCYMSLLCFRICAMKSGSRCITRRWFIWRTPGAMDGGILLSWEGKWREAAHRTRETFALIHRGPHMFGVAIIVNHLLCSVQYIIHNTSWPLVGNEGMNPQYTNVKVDSLIPY